MVAAAEPQYTSSWNGRWNDFFRDVPSPASDFCRIRQKKLSTPISRQEAARFHKKTEQLTSEWSKFTSRYLLNPELGNNNLLVFCDQMIRFFNQSKTPSEKEIPMPQRGTSDLKIFASLINGNIPEETQAKFWQSLDKHFRQQIIDEQKHKYGTKVFMNDHMPRIVTQETRKQYATAIKEHRDRDHHSFEDLGFRFLGIGFGGAAFLVKDSEYHPNIPKYVLKVGVTQPGTLRAERFAPLGDEYVELEKLTEFSDRFKELSGQEDHFSQRIARYKDENWQYQYLGRDENGCSVLATEFQEGENVYETAARDNIIKQFIANHKDKNRLNPFIVEGLSDDTIVNFIHYYLEMAKRKINFYDLFPHNMLYNPDKKTLSFLDSCSKPIPGGIHEKILDARSAFGLDMCIYDLISFVVLQEQKHPFTTAIRQNTKLTLMYMGKEHDRNNKALQQARYIRFINKRLSQLTRCLQLGIDKGLYTHERLVEVLSMLNAAFENPHLGGMYYGAHYQAMQKDFSRVTERGKVIVKGLHDYFDRKIKFTYTQVEMPTVSA